MVCFYWDLYGILFFRYAKDTEHIISMLLHAGADVNKVGCEQRTALHYAAARGIDVQVAT